MTTKTRLYRTGVLDAEDFPAEDISGYLAQPDTVVWLGLSAVDHEALTLVADELSLDRFAVEDAVDRRQRPKVDRYEDHLFLAVYGARLDEASQELETHEISVFVTPRALVTISGNGVDLDQLTRSWDSEPDLVAGGPGGLLHGLLDLVVDGHFEVVQALDDRLEELEDLLFQDAPFNRDRQRANFTLRKSLVQLRRIVLPMREVVNTLMRRDLHVVAPDIEPYYQDLYDHVLRVTEWTEGLRDMVTTIFETNLSMQDHRLNAVMKKLTGWAAVVAVPTAVTGYFGQNVAYPGFGTHWGFWMSNIVVVALAAGLYAMFKHRDWI